MFTKINDFKNHKLNESNKLSKLEKDVFEYLYELQNDGKVNMFGAKSYIVNKFKVEQKEAIRLLNLWIKNHKDNGKYNENNSLKSDVELNKEHVKIGDILLYIDSENHIEYEVIDIFDNGFDVIDLDTNKIETYYFDELQKGWKFKNKKPQ